MDTLPHSIIFYIKYPLSNNYSATLSILPELVRESEYKSIFNQRQSNYFKWETSWWYHCHHRNMLSWAGVVCRKPRESLIAGHEDEDGIHYAMITKSYLGKKCRHGDRTKSWWSHNHIQNGWSNILIFVNLFLGVSSEEWVRGFMYSAVYYTSKLHHQFLIKFSWLENDFVILSYCCLV